MALKTKKYLYDVIDSDVSSKVTSSSKSGSTYAGSVVTWEQFCDEGENIADITINGVTQNVYAPEGGSGGSTVVVTPTVTSGTKLADISVDSVISSIFAPSVSAAASLASGTTIGTVTVGGSTTTFKAPTPTSVSIDRKTTSGTNIADITINGTTTQLYAPTSGGGGVSSVVVNPIVTSGTNIATINVDGTSKTIKAPTIPTITASQITTSGTNIGKISINGTETVFKAPTTSVTTYVASGTHIADIVADGTTKALYAPTASVTAVSDPLIPSEAPILIGEFTGHYWFGATCYAEFDSTHKYFFGLTYQTKESNNDGKGWLWQFDYSTGKYVSCTQVMAHHANGMCFDYANKVIWVAPAVDYSNPLDSEGNPQPIYLNYLYKYTFALNSTTGHYEISNPMSPNTSTTGPTGWTNIVGVSYDYNTSKLWILSNGANNAAFRVSSSWATKALPSDAKDMGTQELAVHGNYIYMVSGNGAYRVYQAVITSSAISSITFIKYGLLSQFDQFNYHKIGEYEGWEFNKDGDLIASAVRWECSYTATSGGTWNDNWATCMILAIPNKFQTAHDWHNWPKGRTYPINQNEVWMNILPRQSTTNSNLYINANQTTHPVTCNSKVCKPSRYIFDGDLSSEYDLTCCELKSMGNVEFYVKNNATVKIKCLILDGTHVTFAGTNGTISFTSGSGTETNGNIRLYDGGSVDFAYGTKFSDPIMIRIMTDESPLIGLRWLPTSDGTTAQTIQIKSAGGNITNVTQAGCYFGNKLLSYANHTHSIANVTNLQSTLDGKASTSHTHTKSQITDLVNASVTQDSSTGDITLEGIVAGSSSASHTHTRSQITDLPIQSGYTSNTIEAGSLYVDGSVTFETPFASRPHVQLSTYTSTTSAEGVAIFVLTSVTNTGFTYRGWRITSTSSSLRTPAIWWLAIGTESMS